MERTPSTNQGASGERLAAIVSRTITPASKAVIHGVGAAAIASDQRWAGSLQVTEAVF